MDGRLTTSLRIALAAPLVALAFMFSWLCDRCEAVAAAIDPPDDDLPLSDNPWNEFKPPTA